MLPTGACGEILASCLPLKERKPVYECFSKTPGRPLELAYWQGLGAEASVALMQPMWDVWKAGPACCTSVKALWLELQLWASQTPEHRAMKLSAAVRETQASSEVCSGRIPLLLVLFTECCCLWTPWVFDNLWEVFQTSRLPTSWHLKRKALLFVPCSFFIFGKKQLPRLCTS